MQAVAEQPFRLLIAEQEWCCGTATPSDWHELAYGRLLTDGRIGARGDVQRIEIEEGAVTAIRVVLHGAGVQPANAQRPTSTPPLPAFPDLFRALFRFADERSPIGGVHAAALTRGAQLDFPVIDVGRHNSVDKAIGAALMAAQPLEGFGLVITARMSGEIVRKAAQAGLAWLASRSLPTTMAIDIARAAGMTLIARAPSTEAMVILPDASHG